MRRAQIEAERDQLWLRAITRIPNIKRIDMMYILERVEAEVMQEESARKLEIPKS